MAKTDKLPELSDDAMVALGSLFAFGPTELSFQMRESRPSDRMQAALDELVTKGVLFRESINRCGGVRYKPVGHDLKPAKKFAWDNRDNKALAIPMTKPL